jgi:predicted aldo/keto reductase-like oxidoreductase
MCRREHAECTEFSRRDFLCQTGYLAGALALGAAKNSAAAEPASAAQGWPTRVLGRTGIPVTTMTLGTAPCGLSKHVSVDQIAGIIQEALDLGITSIDTAPKYIKSEEGIGKALGRRRKDVFLATKVWADTIAEAEESFSSSLRLLRTDHVDLVYYHSVGHRQVEGARGEDGVFTWLLKQKQAGKFRFLGISGHHMPGRFNAFLESGDVDVLLTVVNIADRYTYRFEEEVLPVARKHNVGIVAMKVFGGAKKMDYNDRTPQLDVQHLELAVRYALGVPGVTTVNLGVYDTEQLRKNVEMVKNYRPLEADQQTLLAKLGRELAAAWGPHFGPVG